MYKNGSARYARQIALPGWGADGQECLRLCSALIVGLGGLGTVAARYLAGAGVGALGLADKDRVELSNLHRQILYDETDIGARKTDAAAARLRAVNPDIALRPYHHVKSGEWQSVMAGYDAVVDCTDNFPARFTLHEAAHAAGVPFIYAAAEAYGGALCVFEGHKPDMPCLECLMPRSASEAEEGGCAALGVLPSVPGAIGAMAAGECLALLLALRPASPSVLMRYDALKGEWRNCLIKKDPHCPLCAA